MAIWKESGSARKQSPSPDRSAVQADDQPAGGSSSPSVSTPPKTRDAMESLIGPELTIEGKIEGSGHVRLVGRFKGDVDVDGNLTIEKGARVSGSVRAVTVVIAGELEGNIEAASEVELLETGVMNGDIKAGSVTVAAGSRMRGQAEFGWEEKEALPAKMRVETGSTP